MKIKRFANCLKFFTRVFNQTLVAETFGFLPPCCCLLCKKGNWDKPLENTEPPNVEKFIVLQDPSRVSKLWDEDRTQSSLKNMLLFKRYLDWIRRQKLSFGQQGQSLSLVINDISELVFAKGDKIKGRENSLNNDHQCWKVDLLLQLKEMSSWKYLRGFWYPVKNSGRGFWG